jgi:hypothetical protein
MRGPTDLILAQAGMIVREQAPEAWQHFIFAVQQFAGNAAADMVACPPDSLQRAQGMAQMAARFADVLTNAPALVERAKEVERGRPGIGGQVRAQAAAAAAGPGR